ncbi:Mss4-like protein [Dendryphion nanum]|uniref:Mss4-like protein n=1 Tax=Dendryphion nanum TaxID=256645 RepID=A0A9P9DBB3_9PLEO|nr:Mss4-like protein [Dendryphion nanum]
MNGSCQCGAITFTTPTPQPTLLFHCHCIDCRKQSSSAFGTSAIFPFFALPSSPTLAVFQRACDSGRKQNCYFCSRCGCRILHAHIIEEEGKNPEVVAVKAGSLDGELDWISAKHIFCRTAVVTIPDGVDRWEAEPDFKGRAKK